MADFSGVDEVLKFLKGIKEDSLTDKNTTEVITQKIDKLLLSPSSRLSCRMCGINEFGNLTEFKAHRQSPEHLQKLIDDSDEKLVENESNDEPRVGSPRFTITYAPKSLTLYKTLLVDKKNPLYDQSSLQLDLTVYKPLKQLSNSNILIALNGGGYFAAAMFSVPKKTLSWSKTFKRYTSRRKQGGTQSSKDNAASGNIHSAGAIIRRENEKKLRLEISELLENRFSATQSDTGPVLIFCNRDPYLLEILPKYGTVRTLPFTTYQACFEEASRCFSELMSIKCSL